MKKRIYKIWLILLCSVVGVANAQQTDELKREINKVKKSTLYLYAETTMPDKKEALSTALEMLEREAQRWVQQKKSKEEIASDLILTNIEQISNRMELPRGNMYRAFVYVRKSDIIMSQNTKVSKIEKTASDGQEENSFRSSRKPKMEAVVEIQPEAVQRLLALTEFKEIEPCVSALKQEGKIIEYRQYANLLNPEEYILIVYNRDYKVVAVLSEGKERMNLKTNVPDGVANYKGCGAVGVKLVK